MKILVINAGSSSLKYQLMDPAKGRDYIAKGLCERIGIEGSRIKHQVPGKDNFVKEEDMPDHAVAVKLVLDCLLSKEHGVIDNLQEIEAVGHRVVHGGEKFAKSAYIDEKVKEAIRECYPLAPLHNPANMTGIESMEKALPNVPGVAVFDTAFHQSMPKEAFMYALPYEYYEKYSLRRYGFHGTSHKFVAGRCREILNLSESDSKIVTCHLGNGSSITAVKNSQSIDTSMGMTPLAGVCMGTRCGDIDPAIVPFLIEKENLSTKEVDSILNKKSGVAGISGVGSDFRDLGDAAASGNERAELALEIFAYQCKKIIGSYIAAMDGCDAIVFTAGIGENDTDVRRRILEGLESFGVKLNREVNDGLRGKEAEISTSDSKVKVLVIPTDEEFAIASDTEAILTERK